PWKAPGAGRRGSASSPTAESTSTRRRSPSSTSRRPQARRSRWPSRSPDGANPGATPRGSTPELERRRSDRRDPPLAPRGRCEKPAVVAGRGDDLQTEWQPPWPESAGNGDRRSADERPARGEPRIPGRLRSGCLAGGRRREDPVEARRPGRKRGDEPLTRPERLLIRVAVDRGALGELSTRDPAQQPLAAAYVALHRVGLLEQHDRPQHARRVVEARRGRRPLDRSSRGREEIDVRLKALARCFVGAL